MTVHMTLQLSAAVSISPLSVVCQWQGPHDADDGAEASAASGACKTVHAWVLVMPGKRDVTEPIFLEPTTVRVGSWLGPVSAQLLWLRHVLAVAEDGGSVGSVVGRA